MNPRKMTKYKEVIAHVLQLYKELTFLWDKKNNDYTNKERRQQAYQVLLNAYKEYDEYATVKELVDKIQNFRTSYIRELKKVRKSLKSGREYVPSLWYYNALSFLEVNVVSRENVKVNCSSRNTTKTESLSSASESEGDHQKVIHTREGLPHPRKRKRLLQVDPLQQHDSIQDKFEKYPKMKDDEWEVLGKSIGLQLRDLNKRQLAVTQKIISDAIFYAKIGLLSEKSYIALEKSSSSYRSRKKRSPYRKQSSKLISSTSPEYSTYSEASSPLPPTQHLII